MEESMDGHRRRPVIAAFFAGAALVLCGAPAGAQVGVGITIPSAAISTISDPNQAIAYARQLIEVHDIHGAVIALQRYVMNNPDETDVVRFLGDLYFSSGDFAAAADTYEHLIRNYPFDRDSHYQLGRLYAVENQTNAAIEQFSSSLPDVRAIFYLVDLHARKGDLAAFREQIEQTAEAHPNDINAQLNAAQLFSALYMPRDSAIEFQRAMALDPKSDYALEGLAMAQTAEGADDDALQTTAHCLKVDEKNYGCLISEGVIDTDLHRFDAADAALERAQSLMPEEPDAIFWLGRLYDERGDWHKAITFYEQAAYVFPYSADPYVQIAYDDEIHGLHTQATSIVQEGLHAADDARLHYLLGYMEREDGQNRLALAQFLLAEQSLSPEVAQLAKQSAQELQRTTQP
jgi:tetratricopeptide (TPR) repeat protein